MTKQKLSKLSMLIGMLLFSYTLGYENDTYIVFFTTRWWKAIILLMIAIPFIIDEFKRIENR